MQHTQRRVFRAGIVPTIATLALAPALAGLGFWQLSRADYKQSLIDGYEQAAAGAPVLADISRLDPLADRYRHVAVSGTFDASHQILLDAMVQGGQAGFQVLTPLRVEGSNKAVMVNRGWVAATGERTPAAELAVGGERRRVQGIVSGYQSAGLALGDAAPDSRWPRTLLFPQVQQVEAALGYPVLPWQLLLDADQPDGFERQWRPATEFGPERHIGYAVQWFALCATLIIIYIVVNYRREETA